jgi:excisionase family DNA binding protein
MQTKQLLIFDPSELENLITKAVNSAIENKLQHLTPAKENEYLTSRQTANLLGIALSTLHEYKLAGKIVAYRIGSRVRYKRNDIELALKQIRAANKALNR